MLTPSRGIEAARFFAIADSPKYFTEMIPAVLTGTKVMTGKLYLGASVTTLFAKTAHADCSFSAGSGSQAEPLLFVDLSLVELLQLVLTIVLPKFVPLSDRAREKVVERILFHAAVQAGAYSVLDHIAAAPSMLEFDDSVFGREIGLRTMIAVDCLAGHELGHWQIARNIEDSGITPDFKAHIIRLSEAGVDRLEKAHQDRYPAEELDTAVKAVRSELEYWWADGWLEIVCDILGLRSAWLFATELNIPVASYATTIATLHQLTGAIGLAGAIIRGRENAFGSRSMARSIIFESMINDMAEAIGVPADIWSHAVQFRKWANRRFVDLVATPLLERAQQLQPILAASKRPSRQAIVVSMARHKFAPRPAGYFHLCTTGSGV